MITISIPRKRPTGHRQTTIRWTARFSRLAPGRIFGDPQADILQLKSILAAQIIGILDDRNLSVRKAQQLTGVAASEFSRVRNAKLTRFTVDRLMTILNKLDQEVEVTVTTRPRTHTPHRVSV